LQRQERGFQPALVFFDLARRHARWRTANMPSGERNRLDLGA